MRSAPKVVCLLVLAAGCGESPAAVPSGPPPAVVQVVTAEARLLPRTLSAVGSLDSPKAASIAAEIAGTVVTLDVPEGERVAVGHVLAKLDDAAARAALQVAEARRENARDRLARQEPLFQQGVASKQALDDARAELRAAEGEFQEAWTRLDKHTIRTPYAGEVGLRQVNIGQYVTAGQPIVEITITEGLELRFHLPQQDLPLVAVGQPVHGVVGRCEARFEAKVSALDPRVDEGTRMFRVQAAVANGAASLHPGMAVRLRLLVEQVPDAVLLPQEAVVRQGTRYVVCALDAEGRAQPRPVELGEFFVDGVHVLSGVAPGERVVASGQQKLQPGAPVDPRPWEATRNPNVELGRFGPADCDPS